MPPSIGWAIVPDGSNEARRGLYLRSAKLTDAGDQ